MGLEYYAKLSYSYACSAGATGGGMPLGADNYYVSPNSKMEIKEPDPCKQAAHLLILAAALLAEDDLVYKELLVLAESMSHPVTIFKEAEK